MQTQALFSSILIFWILCRARKYFYRFESFASKIIQCSMSGEFRFGSIGFQTREQPILYNVTLYQQSLDSILNISYKKHFILCIGVYLSIILLLSFLSLSSASGKYSEFGTLNESELSVQFIRSRVGLANRTQQGRLDLNEARI